MSKVFIIAEAGVNHNGSEALALKLVDVAADCGSDAVKFQTFSADKLVAPGTLKADYQRRQTGGGDQHSMLKALELSDAAHRRLANRCTERGIEFMSTPFDEGSADMLVSLGMRRIKVPSGEITNLPFLRFLAGKGLPLIISTGMADMAEIRTAVAVVRQTWQKHAITPGPDQLTVLHCTSNYPAEFADVNMRAMGTIASETGLPVGYSDHTRGIAISIAAAALGAAVIEKHFTTDVSLPGPDHSASLSPRELAELVAAVRAVGACLGSPVKAPTASELPVRALVRRSVTLLRDVEAGEPIALSDVTLLRPGTGIPPSALEGIDGRRAVRRLSRGATVFWTDIG